MNPCLLARAAGLVILAGALLGSAAARTRDTEEQLLARLQSEHNPVRRAKYEMQLGQMKLEQSIEAYEQGNVELGGPLLDAYLERMKDAWQTLHSSGRNAARQPQGFKELDIALRQDSRLLEDLTHRISFYDRGPVEKVAKEIEGIRSEVLRALFPAERSPAPGGTPTRPRGPS